VKVTIPDKVQPQSISLIVYAPEMRQEKYYDVVET
jgi:hypothetical protein